MVPDPAPMRFDLITLHLVLAIADTRSITRGAERENLALAAASKRLSDLEARLGVALFERRARGVEPTEAGRALVRHVRNLDMQLHALESEVVEFAHGIKGHLRIAANAGAISECLPPDLAAFSQAHPQIRISLEDQTSAEVQAAVAEGRADVGIFVPPLLDNGAPFVALDEAALQAGVVHVPLPLFFTPEQLTHALRAAGVDTLIAAAPLAQAASTLAASMPRNPLKSAKRCQMFLLQQGTAEHIADKESIGPVDARIVHSCGDGPMGQMTHRKVPMFAHFHLTDTDDRNATHRNLHETGSREFDGDGSTIS